jgi:nicotinate-nucleotide adenylyltransferase
MNPDRLGIYGGTFNPIHTGHLIIAQEIYEQCKLDRLLFIPSARPPHKHHTNIISPEHRYRMVKLAIQDDPRFEVSDLEIHRPGLSYTIETLKILHQLYGPSAAFFFIIGADSLLEIDTWREPDQVFKLATMVVVPRLGVDVSKANLRWQEQMLMIQSPEVEISSTEIRERLEENRSIRYMVPQQVEAYIQKNRLYTKE